MANKQQSDSFPSNSTSKSGGSKKDAKSKGGKLDPPTIETIAQLIKTGKAKRIVIMTGAGISTAAGIPDFRTPGTGLYDNLQKYDLPYPEAIFDIGYFKENPEPFFSLARELYPGRFLPTLTHYFLTFLHRKGLLYRCFTQNIDTLERLAGLPDNMIVEAHGSFAKSKCLECNKLADVKWIKDIIEEGKIPICVSCKVGIVKPCITFFGECLPDNFFLRLTDFHECDLLIVIGTSLQVQPFASLIDSVGGKIPRLLINLEKVGIIGEPDMGFDFDGKYHKHRRDAFYKGTCDEGVKKLAELCGWKDELLQFYEKGCASLIKEFGAIPTSADIAIKVEAKTRAEEVVDQLTKEREDKIKKDISDEVDVDQMLKEFEKISLKEKNFDSKELLNEEEDTVKQSKEKKEGLKGKDDKENLINKVEDEESKESRKIEEKMISEEKKPSEKSTP